jgi:undecaprenyl-diphosphatase
MKKKYLCISISSLLAFVMWTLLVCFVDVRAIGPNGSSVGFAALNGFVHEKIGTNMYLYNITDWLGLVPIGVALGFAILGLIQLIKRKSLLRVDRSILALGVFYIIVVAVYLFFESVIINYRPVLIEGCLEASYPSSTTMLVTCVMPSAAMQAKERIKNKALRQGVIIVIIAFIAFMVVGRLLSGVHWITDIIGGALFSLGVVMAYKSFLQK